MNRTLVITFAAIGLFTMAGPLATVGFTADAPSAVAAQTEKTAETAGTPETPENPERPLGGSLTTLNPDQVQKLSPLTRELREILLQEAADIKVLTDGMVAVKSPVEALDVQRLISGRKFQTQIELLEAQGRHARESGNVELAEEAENAVSLLKAENVSRPAVQRGN